MNPDSSSGLSTLKSARAGGRGEEGRRRRAVRRFNMYHRLRVWEVGTVVANMSRVGLLWGTLNYLTFTEYESMELAV